MSDGLATTSDPTGHNLLTHTRYVHPARRSCLDPVMERTRIRNTLRSDMTKTTATTITQSAAEAPLSHNDELFSRPTFQWCHFCLCHSKLCAGRFDQQLFVVPWFMTTGLRLTIFVRYRAFFFTRLCNETDWIGRNALWKAFSIKFRFKSMHAHGYI